MPESKSRYPDEWNEAIRLLHKFFPESKSYIYDFCTLNIDRVHAAMHSLSVVKNRELINGRLDSVQLVQKYYGEFLANETGRVLILPNLICDFPLPIVCYAQKLLERIEEGIPVEGEKGTVYCECVDGNTDVVFVFESSGAVLAFDHHEGVVLAMPY
ncbi:hypothetical protein [Zooshikella ganghwensis]|uniref:hypothetical protein n=1 Tax=Zooshikella ganghwensis TaxID=202772 RepID=UPI0004887A19|nr:hypothetical protein [Zooshikella ganghwensis]